MQWCSLSGDGSAEAEQIRDAAERQRDAAVVRLEHSFPGWTPLTACRELGMATPTVVPTTLGDDDRICSSVDEYLRTGDLTQPRAMVVSAATGRTSPVSSDVSSGRATPSAPVTIDPFRGADLLSAGSTLALNDAQSRLGPRIQELTDDLARALLAHVQVNVYVSQGEAPGFGTHWDDHDVIAIPVAGSKYWEVEEPSALAPIKDVIPPGGTGRVVWSGVLGVGGALAIPRGWPHRVSGIGEDPSVHLTVSARRPTGLDLLVHLPVERFERRDLEVTVSEMEHCLGSWASMITVEARNGPVATTQARSHQFRDARLSAVLPGGAVFVDALMTENAVAMAANNRSFVLDRYFVAAFVALLGGAITVEELTRTAGLTRSDVMELIDILGRAGLLRWEKAE